MDELEAERVKIEELEIELKRKKIAIRKQELELIRQSLEEENEEQELAVEESKETEESIAEAEVEENEQQEEGLDITEQAQERGFDFNKLRIGFMVYIVIVVCLIVNSYFNSEEYYAKVKANQEYEEKAAKSKELILEDVEQYDFMTYSDIIDIFGEPDRTSIFIYSSFIYDMGDYQLYINFKHGFVYNIAYIPDEPYVYKEETDAFYVFGMEEDIDKFNNRVYGEITEGKYHSHEAGYPISSLSLYDIDSKEKTAKALMIDFDEHYPEQEVFEDDFSDTPVIYDLVGLLGRNHRSIYKTLGSDFEDEGIDKWVYHADLGTIKIYFSDDGYVSNISFEAYEPIKYEESTQEIMVMFGANPSNRSIQLVYYGWDRTSYAESYEDRRQGVSWTDFHLDGINLDEKTFRLVSVSRFY